MKREHFIPKTDLKIIADDEKFSFTIDSILLTDFAKMKKGTNLIDIGCGTGILMLRCNAMYNLSKCIGIEIQKDVADMLKETIAINNLENVEVINDDFKNVYIKNDSIDNIIVNPPYQKNGHGISNKNTNFHTSRYDNEMKLEDLFEFAKLKLKSNRSLFMINRCERLVDLLSIARKYNMEAKRIRFVQSRIDDKPNLVMIQFVKNQKPFLTFEKNLNIYDGEYYTEEVMNIYGITKV